MCKEVVDCRIETGAVIFGYVYWSGAAHFASMERVDIPVISVKKNSGGLLISLEGESWLIEE
jgi:hypothetical protein